MIYSCPKDFKNGKYFFNKYGILDQLERVAIIMMILYKQMLLEE